MSVATYTKAGTKATTATTLDKGVFGVTVTSHELLKQAYVAHLSNGRVAGAKVKTRGEIRGGGKKPWKQKGTGRARFGSSRNPIWRGGGIVFGPTGTENYTKKLPVTMKRQALRQALSLAAQEKRVKVIEAFELKTATTKAAAAMLGKIEATGNILLVINTPEATVSRATSNLAGVELRTAQRLNVYDVLNADCLVITKPALEAINTWLGGKQ